MVYVFISLFAVCFVVFWFTLKPTAVEKKTEERLKSVTRPLVNGVETRLDSDGLLRPANGEGGGPFMLRSALWLRLLRLLEESNSNQSPRQVMMWSVGCAAAASLLVLMFFPVAAFAAGAGFVGFSLPILRLKWQRGRRLTNFEKVLPDSLDLMARALRSGHALNAAIEIVADQGREPVSSEFRALYQQQTYGLPFRDALDAMLRRIPSNDLQFAGTAMLVQKETGGNLAEILDRTVEIMRERAKLRGEIKTKTAQGRLTGIILALLPVVMLLMISIINPDYAKLLTHTSSGHMMLYVAGGMITVGWLIINQIVKIEV